MYFILKIFHFLLFFLFEKKFIKSTKRYKTMIINNPTHNVNEFKNMFETNNGQKIKNKIELIDKLYLVQ